MPIAGYRCAVEKRFDYIQEAGVSWGCPSTSLRTLEALTLRPLVARAFCVHRKLLLGVQWVFIVD